MKIKYILLLTLLAGALSTLSAQVNTDSLYYRAVELSRNQQLDLAIGTTKKAIAADSSRVDVLVLLANLYSWQNKNDSALNCIKQVRKFNYKSDDFYEAWTNILIRSKKYDEFISNSVELDNNYSKKDDLLKKKLIAYSELGQYDAAIELIENRENKPYIKSNKAINDLYSAILLQRNTNILSAYYTLDMFDTGFAAQHLASLGYSFKVNKHNLGFRANYANRFGFNDLQLESDFYLKLKKKQYMYFNYGYAFNANLFPQHRAGIEYYFPIMVKSEASIGGRYLNYATSDVYIATGHIGKYVGKSWIALRPFLVYKLPTETTSFSLICNYRLFGKTELDYWGAELGFGNSPDDYYSTTQTGNFNQLSTYKIKLEKNFMVNRISDFHIALGYAKEEFGTTQFRSRFTVDLGYKLRLK